jgi:hypothetical protein
MAESKENFPGARLWLDFRNISGQDHSKVEQYLNEIGDLKARIVFLEKLKATYIHALDGIYDEFKKLEKDLHSQYLQEGLTPEQATRLERRPREAFVERGKRFELWIEGKLKYLNKMLKIESEAQPPGKPEAPGSEAAKTIASKELGPVKALTAAQRVWLFHFLLEMAGMREDELSKAEIAKFIVAATGSEPGKVYKHVLNPEQETNPATYRDLTAVRSWFSKLKMAEMAKKVDRERKNFEGSGT